MLHAIIQGKTTHWRRYRGERDATMGRVCEEDEITSTFLGPQAFMLTDTVYRFWQEVFEHLVQKNALPPEPPSTHALQLWPRRQGGDDRYIEPDAYLTFTWPDGRSKGILIEFKWRAPLSGDNQLLHQWKHFLKDDERKDTWHLFIGLEISAGASAKNSADEETWVISKQDRLLLLSWSQIQEMFLQINKSSLADPVLKEWITTTIAFLHRIGIRSFNGFASAHKALPLVIPKNSWSFRGNQ